MTGALLLLVELGGNASQAYADRGADGFYGRWDNDSSLGVSLGTVWELEESVGAYLGVRWLLLDAAGLSTSLAHWPGQGSRIEVSVELQPLFPALPLRRLATYRAWWDLWIQSLSIECGVAWSVGAGQKATPGLVVGMGFELPLILPRPGGWRLGLGVGARRRFGMRGGWEPAQNGWALRFGLALRVGIDSGVGEREPN